MFLTSKREHSEIFTRINKYSVEEMLLDKRIVSRVKQKCIYLYFFLMIDRKSRDFVSLVTNIDIRDLLKRSIRP